MFNLKRVLMYEILRYYPPTLRILESTCKGIQASLYSDITYIHYFIEDMYKVENHNFIILMDTWVMIQNTWENQNRLEIVIKCCVIDKLF